MNASVPDLEHSIERPTAPTNGSSIPALRKRIGFAVMSPFLTIDNGGALRRAQLAWSIAQSADLHVIYLGPSAQETHAGAPTLVELPFGLRAPVWRSRNVHESRGHLLKRVWAEAGLDAVVIDWIGAAADAMSLPGSVPVILNTHNVESDLYLRFIRDGGVSSLWRLRRWRQLRASERTGMERANEMWFVSEPDRIRYQRLLGGDIRTRIVPNVASPASFTSEPEVGQAGVGMFVGSMAYPPNRRAVEQLVDLSDRFSISNVAHRFELIGPGDLTSVIGPRKHVVHRGYLPDLSTELQRAAVFLAPLTYGGGTKTKVLDAMAAGRAILTTPAGVEGFEGLRHGEEILVHPLGGKFRDVAAQLLHDPEAGAEIGKAAQQYVRSRYTMHHMLIQVSDSIDTLFADTRRPATALPGMHTSGLNHCPNSSATAATTVAARGQGSIGVSTEHIVRP